LGAFFKVKFSITALSDPDATPGDYPTGITRLFPNPDVPERSFVWLPKHHSFGIYGEGDNGYFTHQV
jgi:hypothetical protein